MEAASLPVARLFVEEATIHVRPSSPARRRTGAAEKIGDQIASSG
jgi:hypothetical protein